MENKVQMEPNPRTAINLEIAEIRGVLEGPMASSLLTREQKEQLENKLETLRSRLNPQG